MSYMRGKNYIWSDGEGVHFWSATGNDYWFEAGWHDFSDSEDTKIINPDHIDPEGNTTASGVYIENGPIDKFVVMRFAELLAESKLKPILENTIESESEGLERAGFAADENFRVKELKTLQSRLSFPDED